jgi:hypothetical protein
VDSVRGTKLRHNGPMAQADLAAQPTRPSEESATRVFSRSIMISALRCTLAYVILPWVVPAVGHSVSVGPWVGLTIGVIAIGFNIASIRRFWLANHRYKYYISAMNLAVIGLLLVLAVRDLNELFGN